MDLSPPIIHALEEEVVNRIAAGEVVQRPTSALKELLENSIDSGADQINVTIKEGGFKLLQVQDNGHGIRYEDLSLLCNRHTTSKIRVFEDLEKIQTLGFRGEALCSISFVSRLTVTTMAVGMQNGYRVKYLNGEMLPEGPIPCAANPGTIMTVEDLFYNNFVRRSGVKNTSDEFSKVLDIIERYGIHLTKIGFILKRVGHTNLDLNVVSGTPQLDRISSIFGLTVANSLLPFQGSLHSQDGPDFEYSGFLSNVEYSGHRSCFVLFINDRCVECGALKRAVDSVYVSILSKPIKTFVYLSLYLPTVHVDVNIHPTKREVEFLFKEELIQSLIHTFTEVLSSSNKARSFQQMKISKVILPTDLTPPRRLPGEKILEHKLVRTDSKQQNLKTCLVRGDESFIPFPKRQRHHSSQALPTSSKEASRIQKEGLVVDPFEAEVERAREDVQEDVQTELKALIRDHSYVGMADQTRAFVQYQTGLYLLDMEILSEDFFYWILLQNIGHFSKLSLESPVLVRDLISGLVEDENSQEVDKKVVGLLEKREELNRLLSIEISDLGSLLALPCLLESFIPDMDYLPLLFIKLSRLVEQWSGSFSQTKALLKATAQFYSIKESIGKQDDNLKNEWNVKHVVLPSMRNHYSPSKTHLNANTIMKVTSIEELYRRFGRC